MISAVKALESTTLWLNTFMWGYLFGGALLAGFGAYHEHVPMMLTALAVVCGIRIYEEWLHQKGMPLWRSIISKYEAALDGDDD